MFNYIKRELQCVFKKKETLITAISIVVICFIANLSVMAFTLIYGSDRDGVLGSNVLAFASWCFIIPFYACIIFADTVFGKEYPNPYIKDKITKNMSRTKIYLGKYLTTVILAMVYMIEAFIFLMITTRIFHSDISAYDVTLFVNNMLISIPLWLAGLAISDLCLFSFTNKKKAYITFIVAVIVIPRIIMFLAAEPISFGPCIAIRTILMAQSFGHIPYPADPARNVPFIIAEGFIYTIVALIAGIVIFNKKQIIEAE